MLKVLLVDDETLVRNHLKKIINWNENGLEIVGEASNGFAALKFLEKNEVDIIILDIKMPVMDGLDFLKKIREAQYPQKIIILSSYEDFYYAQQAIRLGAVNYLLKHLLDREALVSSLTEVKEAISKENHLIEELALMKKKIDIYDCCTAKDKFFAGFIADEYNEAQILTDIKRLGLDLVHGILTPVVFRIKESRHVKRNPAVSKWDYLKAGILETMRKKLEENASGEAFIIGEMDFCVLFAELRIPSMAERRNRLLKLIGIINQETSLNYSLEFMTAVGPAFSDIRNFREAYRETCLLFDYKIFFNNCFILTFDEIKPLKKEAETEKIRNILKNFKTMLLEMNAKDADSILRTVFLGEIKSSMDLKAYNSTIRELKLVFMLLQQKYEGNLTFTFDEDQLDELGSIEAVYEWFSKMTIDLITKVKSMESSDNKLVAKVIDYIRKYYKEDITLESAAKEVLISKIYLSQLFKKETGENFIDFLTRIRVDKAKQLLLKTRMKREEIAASVGFGSPKYFSEVFKKQVGMTLQEFRNSSINSGEI